MNRNLSGILSGKIDEMLQGSVAGDISLITPSPEPPVLETLDVTENGTYTPPSGVDGYNEVSVNVPSEEPTLETLNVTENGTYTPPTGVDGYNEVNVDVPLPVPPVLNTLNVTENGTYTPPAGVDGYDEVIVNVDSYDLPLLEDYPYKHNNNDSASSNVAFTPYYNLPSGITTDNIKLSLTALNITGTSNFTSSTSVSSVDTNTNTVYLSWGEQSGTSKQYFDIVTIPDLSKYELLTDWTVINQDITTVTIDVEGLPQDVENYIVEFKDCVSGVTGISENLVVQKSITSNTLTITIPISSTHHAVSIRVGVYS